MEPDHFRPDLSRVEAVRLFQRHVELIEVETTSYCNRTCSFCPNSFIDRRSEKLTMPEATWQAILDGLREISYDGTLVWSRYSEPLSERRILERIREVREAAPKSRICINSNGDYLEADYLADLEKAGLDRLWIDVYIPDEELYDVEVATSYHNKFLERIGRSCKVSATSPELACRIDSQTTEIVTRVRNLASMKAQDLSDRGGLIQLARQTLRTSPCYLPYKHLVFDWDGSIMLCCQVRSDSPTHKAGVVGKIGADGVGLVDAYIRLAGWRDALSTYGPKGGPCANCNVSEYESNSVTRTLSQLLVNTEGRVNALMRKTLQPIFRKRLRY